MKKIWAVILLCTLVQGAAAQQRALQVGDQLPNFLFTNVLNYEKTSFRLSNLQSKVTLIELWSSHCGSCLASMVRMNELKKKYGSQVAFLFVTLDSAQAVQAFLKKRKDLAAFRQPLWPQTEEWRTWFPTQSYPHMIWLDSNRVVKAITAAQYVTEKHLDFLLENQYVHLPVKKDLENFNYHQPFSEPKHGQPFYYSVSFSGPIDGVGGQMGQNDLGGGQKRIYATNATYLPLFSMAWRDQLRLTVENMHTRLQLQIQDSFLLGKDDYGMMRRYCFEMIFPKEKAIGKEQPYQWMRQELDRFFGVKSEIILSKRPALVLFATDSSSNFLEKGSNQVTLEAAMYSRIKAAHLVPAIELYLKPDLPVLYEGPLDKTVALTLKTKYTDWQALRKDLQQAGLDLKIEYKEIAMLRIHN